MRNDGVGIKLSLPDKNVTASETKDTTDKSTRESSGAPSQNVKTSSLSISPANTSSDTQQQRKRKSGDSDENACSSPVGETIRKIQKSTSDQHKDPDTARLRETLAVFARTLALLTQMCDRAVSGETNFSSPPSKQTVRTSRSLSSTLAAAARVASVLSATSVARQRATANILSGSHIEISKSQEENKKDGINARKDPEIGAMTSTPKKEGDLEAGNSLRCDHEVGSNSRESQGDGKQQRAHENKSPCSPERRKTRRSSQKGDRT